MRKLNLGEFGGEKDRGFLGIQMDGTLENMRDVHRFSKVSELICFDASCDMILACY